MQTRTFELHFSKQIQTALLYLCLINLQDDVLYETDILTEDDV